MKDIIIAIRLFIALTIVTGALYPLVVTGIAQTAFKSQANGSLKTRNGTVVGSNLIGQQYDDPKYLWGRPSATSPVPYNAASSSGSNQGPTNPDFVKAIQDRVKTLKDADPTNTQAIPTDLVTASGSGLDPHISLESAEYQLSRIAKARGVEDSKLKELVSRLTEKRTFGVLGEPVVNVLLFNLALDNNMKIQ